MLPIWSLEIFNGTILLKALTPHYCVGFYKALRNLQNHKPPFTSGMLFEITDVYNFILTANLCDHQTEH